MFALPFASGTLDRAERIRNDPDALHQLIQRHDSRFLCFKELDVAMTTPPVTDLHWLPREKLPEQLLLNGLLIFLGLDDSGVGHFAIPLTEADTQWFKLVERFVDTRAAGLVLADGRASIVAFARSLLDWHARRPFCSCCGARNRSFCGGMQLRCEDASCGAVHFPRTDPVVIMLVETPDRKSCLLGRSRDYPPGLVSALAGYMEPGESIEDAVKREIREEAGIGCDNCRYVASQPWPFPSSLMIGCVATATEIVLDVDEVELEWARWFTRNEVRDLFDEKLEGLSAPQPIAIAHHLLVHWMNTG